MKGKTEMETVNHILSKMREPSCFKGKIPVERVDADFRDFADRLEAAIKREREAVGNAAAMREALETISKCDICKEEDCYTLYRVCEAALSAPLRNCDVPTVIIDPLKAWSEDNDVWDEFGNPKKAIYDWLLAEAKGENNEQ